MVGRRELLREMTLKIRRFKDGFSDCKWKFCVKEKT